MAKIHKIKRRIRSVGKVQQITKAMERVAASKMRRAQGAALRSRPYVYAAREILAQLFRLTNPKAHPLFAQRPRKRRMFIVVSSDRGLAGAYNSNLARVLTHAISESAGDKAIPRLIVIGRKGAHFCTHLERLGKVEVLGAYVDWPSEPTTAILGPIINTTSRQFVNRSVDAVFMIYTDFISGSKQQAIVHQLLPVRIKDVFPQQARISESVQEALFEPSPEEVLTSMVPRLILVQLYQAVLEAIASEHSMRMVAMKSASDNAQQLIEDLRITYNSARQASITQELAEISAGVQALAHP